MSKILSIQRSHAACQTVATRLVGGWGMDEPPTEQDKYKGLSFDCWSIRHEPVLSCRGMLGYVGVCRGIMLGVCVGGGRWGKGEWEALSGYVGVCRGIMSGCWGIMSGLGTTETPRLLTMGRPTLQEVHFSSTSLGRERFLMKWHSHNVYLIHANHINAEKRNTRTNAANEVGLKQLDRPQSHKKLPICR